MAGVHNTSTHARAHTHTCTHAHFRLRPNRFDAHRGTPSFLPRPIFLPPYRPHRYDYEISWEIEDWDTSVVLLEGGAPITDPLTLCLVSNTTYTHCEWGGRSRVKVAHY